MMVGKTWNKKIKPKLSTFIIPPRRNSLPALVKSNTKTKRFPTNSNADLTNEIFSTPIAKINCAAKPISVRTKHECDS